MGCLSMIGFCCDQNKSCPKMHYQHQFEEPSCTPSLVRRHSIHLLLVYYIRTSTQPLLLYDPLLFLLIYLNHIRLHKPLSYHSYSLYFFYFTDIKFYIYLCTLRCVYILLLLSCFGCSQYIILFSIIQSSFYHNHKI